MYASGWHFAYFDNVTNVKDKFKSNSHTENALLAQKAQPDFENLMKTCMDFMHEPMRQMEVLQRAKNSYPPPFVGSAMHPGDRA